MTQSKRSLRMGLWIACAAIGASSAVTSMASSPEAAASADYKRGKLLFIQCRACHDVKPSAVEKVGPNLSGLMNRAAAKDPNFAYSPALAKSTLVWDRATLDRWIKRPGEVVPGNIMAFAGVANPADRAALIAYLEIETRTP